MEEIRRQDRKLLIEEVLSFWRLGLLALSGLLLYQAFAVQPMPWLIFGAVVLFGTLNGAYQSARQRRFRNPSMRSLWASVQDRLVRFDEACKRMRKADIASLNEVPNTIEQVGENLYVALRRADQISDEIQRSERGLYSAPPVWVKQSTDAQSQELYQLADRNIAEYRAQFAGVMAGVERTQAQCAVFITTLDTLRMKMIGYSLVGRRPEMSSQDLLESLAEARAQLQSIDTALEELDLGHYPKMVAVVDPPPVQDDLQQRFGQGQ